MTRIAIELDLPDGLAEAAAKQGLLSSSALLELISRELGKNAPPTDRAFNPADYPPGFQPWMVGIVPPDLFGSVRQNCGDEELMEPIDVDWYAVHGSWGPGLEDGHDSN